MDAVPLVQTDAGNRLVGHLLQHYRRYLAGTRDPDVRYRDFQNHVVHVTDGYWGGAPRVAHQWYARLQRYLRSDRFSDAAHAAGVLSHYFTDPFQPLHTQQCPRSAVLHRPFEWTIQLAYDEVLDLWRDDQMRVVFHLSDRPQWLGEAILYGARFANRKYQRVLDQYQLSRAIEHPGQGLTLELRESMAEVFGIAITGWARVLERAALDAEATRCRPLPAASLVPALVDSIVRAPLAWVRGRASYHRQRSSVEALVAEYVRTGRLQQHLPTEVDVVQRVIQVYQVERAWRQQRVAPTAAPVNDRNPTSTSSILPFPQDSEAKPLKQPVRRGRAA